MIGAYFVDLELRRGAEVVSTNTYWLSPRSDVSDHEAATWQNTPTTQLADLKELTNLPPATVKVTVKRAPPPATSPYTAAANCRFAVTLENQGKTLAFFTRMTLRQKEGGPPVAPVFWDDNYLTLRPGARRTVTVSAALTPSARAAAVVEVEGVNVARVTARP
jgi:exo-1,4-beta-D-glucosaminidase